MYKRYLVHLTGPRYQRVLALCALLNRGDNEGTTSPKTLSLRFVYVLFFLQISVRDDFAFFCLFAFVENLWFDDLRAEKIGSRLNCVLALM